MKDGNYTEAFIHWTHAIKLEPEEAKFYFERSKCFLKQQQVEFGQNNRAGSVDQIYRKPEDQKHDQRTGNAKNI